MDCLVLIPDRDYRWFLEKGGHQPPRSQYEFSIPEWDSGFLAQDLKAFESHIGDYIRKIVNLFYWSSYCERLSHVLIWIWWLQSSCTENEIRCIRSTYPFGASSFFETKTTIRTNRMESKTWKTQNNWYCSTWNPTQLSNVLQLIVGNIRQKRFNLRINLKLSMCSLNLICFHAHHIQFHWTFPKWLPNFANSS